MRYLPESFEIPWNPNTRTEVSTLCISQFRYSAQIRPSSVVTKDYTFKRPGWAGRFDQEGQHQDYQRTQYEVYDYPGRFKGAHGQNFARWQMDGWRNNAEVARGTSRSPEIWPGRRIALTGHPQANLNREWQVVASELHGEQPQAVPGRSGSGTTLNNHFAVIPADRTWRPQPLLKPLVDGPQSAVVTGPAGEEIFCDEHGRVRVKFNWDRYNPSNQDSSCSQKDKFGAGKNGFTRGNPQTGTPATDLDDDYFDMLQEELCGVVEASGASLEKGRNDQLLTALRALLLSRKNPFGDIKSDGTVKTALENLGLGEGAPAIGVPFFWPSAAMPNTVIDSWSGMVFLKFNGAKFSASNYPVLAKVFPSLVLPEARGDFIRIWDDGRGADGGRELLSWQEATNFSQFAGNIGGGAGHAINFHDGIAGNQPGFSRFNFTSNSVGDGVSFVAVRPRNITFNFLVRAK